MPTLTHHSHRTHQHTKPLQKKKVQIKPDDHLPKNMFIGVTALFDHTTLVPYRDSKPDDNHIYVWIRIPTGGAAGRYEAAVNVHSDPRHIPDKSRRDLMYVIHEEKVEPNEWPDVGVAKDAKVSFEGLGLKDSDFTTVQAGELRQIVTSYTERCQRMTIFGMSYSEGTGLHDVHFNGGKNKDGALCFYFDSAHGGPMARWIFLKFQNDEL